MTFIQRQRWKNFHKKPQSSIAQGRGTEPVDVPLLIYIKSCIICLRLLITLNQIDKAQFDEKLKPEKLADHITNTNNKP